MNKLTVKDGINTTAIKGVVSKKVNKKFYELKYEGKTTMFYSFNKELNVGDEGLFLLILAPVKEAVTYLFDFIKND